MITLCPPVFPHPAGHSGLFCFPTRYESVNRTFACRGLSFVQIKTDGTDVLLGIPPASTPLRLLETLAPLRTLCPQFCKISECSFLLGGACLRFHITRSEDFAHWTKVQPRPEGGRGRPDRLFGSGSGRPSHRVPRYPNAAAKNDRAYFNSCIPI